MPHLHLSLQPGDDLILKRMKRRHSRADAIRFCDDVRRLRPDMVFGADLIAGFPTETEAMFENTRVDRRGMRARPSSTSFPSRRGRARRPRGCRRSPRQLVKERAARLRAAGEGRLARAPRGRGGATRRVLVERGGVGRTEHFTPVEIGAGAPGDIVPPGSTAPARACSPAARCGKPA